MNEQQFADELGVLIDKRTQEMSGVLPAEDTAFAMRLLTLRDQTHADEGFAAALEARLKTAARSPFRNRPQILNREMNSRADRRGRLVYTMATFAAALVIVAFAVLAVPTLQTLTQNAPATQTEVSVPTSPPEQPSSGYVLASAPLSSGFHVLGRALHYNDVAVSLIESAFTSYVNLMSSVYSDSVSS